MKIFKAIALLTVFIAAANVMEAPAYTGGVSGGSNTVPAKKKTHKFKRRMVGGQGGI